MEKSYSLLSIDPENKKYLEILENDFATLNKEEFYQKYEELIHPIWDEESFYSMAGIDIGKERLLASLIIGYLVEAKELLKVDSSGETKPYMLENFLNSQLSEIYFEKFGVSSKNTYEEYNHITEKALAKYEEDLKAVEKMTFFQKVTRIGSKKETIKWTGTSLGDHLAVLFCSLHNQLEHRGYSLVHYDQGDDQFYLRVLQKDQLEKQREYSYPGIYVFYGERILTVVSV